MKWGGLCLTFLLIFTFSCAPRVLEGRKIDSQKVKQLAAGRTGAATVESFFGKPTKVERLSTGEQKYIYDYCTADAYWWTIDKLQAQKLEVIVKDGVVQNYKFTEEGKEAILK